MSKQTFILGAGFSVPAGLPTQYQLTKELFNAQIADDKKYKTDLHQLNSIQKKFLRFLKDDFGIDGTSSRLLTLEDIYTPLDRCIAEGSSYRSFSPEELFGLRQTLDSILILALKNKSKITKKAAYIEQFSRYVIEKSKLRINNYKRVDPISIITTNWDIQLDLAIRKQLNEQHNNGIIDYNCYVSSLRNDPIIKPGLEALARGKFIVKLLKIHGSINWLHCPKCQRIFIDFYRRVIDYGVFRKRECKYCRKEYSTEKPFSPRLRPLLLMPTFAKDLSNFQTKLIWRNAGVEIAESDEIVFIGYSFPMADFEFRQLLFRNVKRNAKIRVVLFDRNNPQRYLTNTSKQKLNYESAEHRYLSFFSGKNIKITFEGVVQYIESLNNT